MWVCMPGMEGYSMYASDSALPRSHPILEGHLTHIPLPKYLFSNLILEEGTERCIQCVWWEKIFILFFLQMICVTEAEHMAMLILVFSITKCFV